MLANCLKTLFKSTSQSLAKTSTCSFSTRILTKPLINFHELRSALPSPPLLSIGQSHQLPQQTTQSRNSWGYKGRMMLKDIKRRELVRKFGPLRVRLHCLFRNTFLPKVLKVKLFSSH
jgi:hypothetical protein